ncbi:MAG TPA: aspartate ammonia-lyase [Anaerohalosphaeraceae bacterium]|nr:aspartate ammonia-lyase [Anaerohalosphaeraceae bacterium]
MSIADMTETYRSEQDSLGRMDIPTEALYGIHTARAMVNFPYSSRPVPSGFIRAYGMVKQACIQTCVNLGEWANEPAKGEAMLRASTEMASGLLDEHIRVDLFQGGAGTSLNMNVNEVLANRALQILNLPLGSYDRVHPLEDINRCQSTNDTFPTALRVAAIQSIQQLEKTLVTLQEAFQAKEKEFVDVVKIGRTEYQDAVLTTLGREMSAYAEAINRDRWRVYKCVERLRVVNLGGTAIGSGLSAPRDYIFRVTESLRDLTGLGLARAENLIDATQNTDVFVEVSGILKACASSLLKISGDLRLLSSGPAGGLKEITLPPRQAGSSIMPGKVNPVIPESVSQAAMQVLGNDVVISQACSMGSLELNAFLPVIAANLLESIELLTVASDILRRYCVEGIAANREPCRRYVENATAVVTALLPKLGYDVCARIAKESEAAGKSIRQLVIEQHLLTKQEFEAMISPEAVCQLGHVKKKSKP